MEINYDDVLTQDFPFMLDLCPVQAFPANSEEQNLAQKWLEYLCTYEVEDLNDRRLRNIYISHLCTALVQRQLYGPFLKEPVKGEKLEKIDFHAVAVCPNTSMALQPNAHSTMQLPARETSNFTMTLNPSKPSVFSPEQSSYTVINATKTINSTGVESQGQISVGSTNLSFNLTTGGDGTSSPCSCPPKPCQCSAIPCNCNRSTAGADTPHSQDEDIICNYLMQQLNFTPEFLNNFDATLTSFMDLCKVTSVEGRTQNQSKLSVTTHKHYFLPKNPSSLKETETADSSKHQLVETRSVTTPPDYEEMREDINELLEAIKAELCGDSEPGSNDYLDRELSRYKSFLMANSYLAEHLKSLTSDIKLRNCLLLSLQNDLVKLLNEDK
ncbi:uncharacterized protein LOC111675849 [Lucilia cuprina]|uniref:uncharacterized protein LOC111675849 n=1 Tax=Lucilia cuprina TaxID=7375 RepID=UPI001F06E1D8|nr:uncharacterized protein LOC111675849 [Lucilia cuprina]